MIDGTSSYIGFDPFSSFLLIYRRLEIAKTGGERADRGRTAY